MRRRPPRRGRTGGEIRRSFSSTMRSIRSPEFQPIVRNNATPPSFSAARNMVSPTINATVRLSCSKDVFTSRRAISSRLRRANRRSAAPWLRARWRVLPRAGRSRQVFRWPAPRLPYRAGVRRTNAALRGVDRTSMRSRTQRPCTGAGRRRPGDRPDREGNHRMLWLMVRAAAPPRPWLSSAPHRESASPSCFAPVLNDHAFTIGAAAWQVMKAV